MTAENETKTEPAIPKGMKKRKELPSVSYLLKHGDPETAHIPPSLVHTIGYPLILAMVFALSLFIFHNAPWDSAPPHKPYKLPKINKVSRLEKKMHERRIPHLNKDKSDEL